MPWIVGPHPHADTAILLRAHFFQPPLPLTCSTHSNRPLMRMAVSKLSTVMSVASAIAFVVCAPG